jgi:hypothetical protein
VASGDRSAGDERVLLISSETTPADPRVQRFMRDPNGEASNYDIVVCTPSAQAAISIETHFVHGYDIMEGGKLTHDAELQLSQRLRARAGLEPRHVYWSSDGVAGGGSGQAWGKMLRAQRDVRTLGLPGGGSGGGDGASASPGDGRPAVLSHPTPAQRMRHHAVTYAIAVERADLDATLRHHRALWVHEHEAAAAAQAEPAATGGGAAAAAAVVVSVVPAAGGITGDANNDEGEGEVSAAAAAAAAATTAAAASGPPTLVPFLGTLVTAVERTAHDGLEREARERTKDLRGEHDSAVTTRVLAMAAQARPLAAASARRRTADADVSDAPPDTVAFSEGSREAAAHAFFLGAAGASAHGPQHGRPLALLLLADATAGTGASAQGDRGATTTAAAAAEEQHEEAAAARAPHLGSELQRHRVLAAYITQDAKHAAVPPPQLPPGPARGAATTAARVVGAAGRGAAAVSTQPSPEALVTARMLRQCLAPLWRGAPVEPGRLGAPTLCLETAWLGGTGRDQERLQAAMMEAAAARPGYEELLRRSMPRKRGRGGEDRTLHVLAKHLLSAMALPMRKCTSLVGLRFASATPAPAAAAPVAAAAAAPVPATASGSSAASRAAGTSSSDDGENSGDGDNSGEPPAQRRRQQSGPELAVVAAAEEGKDAAAAAAAAAASPQRERRRAAYQIDSDGAARAIAIASIITHPEIITAWLGRTCPAISELLVAAAARQREAYVAAQCDPDAMPLAAWWRPRVPARSP